MSLTANIEWYDGPVEDSGQLTEITIKWDDYDEIGERVNTLQLDGYLLKDDLALTYTNDREVVYLERIEPSAKYPGCYESLESHVELNVKDFEFLKKFEGVKPLELLDKVLMAMLF